MATFDAVQARQVARAWQELGPDDDELRFATTRIAIRLSRSRRGRRGSSAAAALCGVVLAGAALAYAAQAGLPWIERAIQHHAAPARSSSHGALPPVAPRDPFPAVRSRAPAAAATPVSVPSSSESPTPVVAPAPPRRAARVFHAVAPDGTHAATVTAAPDASTAERASWGLVDEALSERDDARAKALLDSIVANASDPHTRASARLGLAQLYAGRGECAEARPIALAVAAEPGVPMAIARRAQRVLSVCFAR